MNNNRLSPYFFLLFCSIAAYLISGCKDTTTTQKPTTSSSKMSSDVEKTANSDIFILNTLVTSEGSGSESWSLFDNKENTIWMTNFGTGIGEYIRINFSPMQENYVDKILIGTQAGGKITRLRKVTIDVNGEYFGVFNTDTKISIKKNLKSLTIHFSLTDDIFLSEKEIDGQLREVQNSPAKKAIGITDILMFDKGGAAMNVRNVQNYNGTITTNSTREPAGFYHATHLFDGNEASVWSGNINENGVGQTLKFDLVGEAPAERLVFYNGNQQSNEHFDWNARVKTFSIKTENQTAQKFTLPDEMTPQVLTFDPPLSGKKYELEILEIYEGEKYNSLTISELSFLRADNQSWRVKTNYQPKKIDFALKTDIGNIVDRYISCTSTKGNSMTIQSLILRSDASFDLRSLDDDGTIVRDLRAFGNWERASNGKVKLSGGMKIIGEKRTTFFSEQLTIKSGYVEGESTFAKLYLN